MNNSGTRTDTVVNVSTVLWYFVKPGPNFQACQAKD